MLYRPLNTWTSWREMERLRREMDRLWQTTGTGLAVAPSFPAMNVWTNEDGAIVTAELPGIYPEDLDIHVTGDTLTIRGEREPEEFGDGETYHRHERAYGKFARTLQLPFAVESEGIEASFERGVLRLALPRSEADRPHKITVKAG